MEQIFNIEIKEFGVSIISKEDNLLTEESMSKSDKEKERKELLFIFCSNIQAQVNDFTNFSDYYFRLGVLQIDNQYDQDIQNPAIFYSENVRAFH